MLKFCNIEAFDFSAVASPCDYAETDKKMVYCAVMHDVTMAIEAHYPNWVIYPKRGRRSVGELGDMSPDFLKCCVPPPGCITHQFTLVPRNLRWRGRGRARTYGGRKSPSEAQGQSPVGGLKDKVPQKLKQM